MESEKGSEYSIRYDGLDAEAHKIDLSQLGISLQGFARVLAVFAHFAYTGNYNKQYDALSVKVFATPTKDHHCYEVSAWIARVASSEYLWSGTGGALLVALMNYFFGKRRAEELKYLNDALQLAMGQNKETTQQLLATIQKMMDSLRPSGRQALAPIDESCATISVFRDSEEYVTLDKAAKARFSDNSINTIEPSRKFTGVISEMDMESGTCKVLLDGSDTGRRTLATITDPIGKRPGNPYVVSMSQLSSISFDAKPEVDTDGNVVRLHISDIA